jgi:hypothetical protein
MISRSSAISFASVFWRGFAGRELHAGWGADEAATDMEASVPTPAAVDPSRQPAVLRRGEFAVALFRICRMDSDASPPLAARVSALLSAPLLSAPLLSAPLLSALLLLLRQSACACSVSGVTASTSRDGDGGMDVEDGDSDAGASEIVCSPGSGRMRSGRICQQLSPYLPDTYRCNLSADTFRRCFYF